MNTYGSSSEDHSRGEVGICAAQYVYGPASVHLLPCKIHHTGEESITGRAVMIFCCTSYFFVLLLLLVLTADNSINIDC